MTELFPHIPQSRLLQRTDPMTSIALETRRASSTTSDLLAVTGRVLLAAIFVLSGVSKLADPAGTIAYIKIGRAHV